MATKFCLVCSLRLHWFWEDHLRALTYKCLDMNILVKSINILTNNSLQQLFNTLQILRTQIQHDLKWFSFLRILIYIKSLGKKNQLVLCLGSIFSFEWLSRLTTDTNLHLTWVTPSPCILLSSAPETQRTKILKIAEQNVHVIFSCLEIFHHVVISLIKTYVAYFDQVLWSEFKQAAPVGGKARLHFLSRRRKKRLWTGTNRKNMTEWNNIRWKPIWAGWP